MVFVENQQKPQELSEHHTRKLLYSEILRVGRKFIQENKLGAILISKNTQFHKTNNFDLNVLKAIGAKGGPFLSKNDQNFIF